MYICICVYVYVYVSHRHAEERAREEEGSPHEDDVGHGYEAQPQQKAREEGWI